MIGKRLGNWILEREIGKGGMGTIYLATEDSPQRRRAAVKVLAQHLAQEAGFVERFEREIQALRQLRHPNIVAFYEAGRDGGQHFYAMEYVPGATLSDLLANAGKLAWGEVLELALQVCPALKHAHDHGIIHRDLKPSNLLVGEDGVVRLLDFGVAKVFANTPLTASHAVIGTADYMSPEQAAGRNVTKRSDLYSLGVVLYHLVTGRTPFVAETVVEMLHKHRYAQFDAPRKLVPDVPHDFDAILCKLLAKEPEQRPADALVLFRELQSLQRKYQRKGRLTTDQVKPSRTVALGTEKDGGEPEDNGEPGPGPATMMSHLMRAELEELNRPNPIDRLFNRVWVVAPLFVLVIGLLVWGLWPKGGAARVAEVERLIAQQEWAEAAQQLEHLQERGDLPPGTDLAALQKQVEDGLGLARAKRRGTAFAAPASAAERFYREAVQDYQGGQPDRARAKWQRLVEAFDGLEAHQPWVVLARDALKKTEAPATDQAAVDEALRRAAAEDPALAERRLQALADLYRDDPAQRRRVEAALAQVRGKK